VKSQLRSNNPLTRWIAEYQRHQPESSPSEAWRFLREVSAVTGTLHWLLVEDDLVFIKRPSRELPVVQTRAAFTRQFERIKKRARQPI
jgi:hypothetical protein